MCRILLDSNCWDCIGRKKCIRGQKWPNDPHQRREDTSRTCEGRIWGLGGSSRGVGQTASIGGAGD